MQTPTPHRCLHLSRGPQRNAGTGGHVSRADGQWPGRLRTPRRGRGGGRQRGGRGRAHGAPPRTEPRAGRRGRGARGEPGRGPEVSGPPLPPRGAPYQEQEAEDAPADHQVHRGRAGRRHLRFRPRSRQGRTGRGGAPRTLKVKRAQGRSERSPRRPRPSVPRRAGGGAWRRQRAPGRAGRSDVSAAAPGPPWGLGRGGPGSGARLGRWLELRAASGVSGASVRVRPGGRAGGRWWAGPPGRVG